MKTTRTAQTAPTFVVVAKTWQGTPSKITKDSLRYDSAATQAEADARLALLTAKNPRKSYMIITL